MNKIIKKLGTIYKTNQNGYLETNIVSLQICQSSRQIVNDFIKVLLDNYQKNLHSIYLRGSIASNNIIPAVSDIDFVVITKQKIT